MSDMRVAMYVYEKSQVTIAPNGLVDLYRMGDDYGSVFVQAISEPTTLDLTPGVYGYVYRDKHGLTYDPASRLDVVLDFQKKKPWPQPPPPPPPSFVGRRDWNEHTALFMSPLAFEENDATETSDAS